MQNLKFNQKFQGPKTVRAHITAYSATVWNRPWSGTAARALFLSSLERSEWLALGSGNFTLGNKAFLGWKAG